MDRISSWYCFADHARRDADPSRMLISFSTPEGVTMKHALEFCKYVVSKKGYLDNGSLYYPVASSEYKSHGGRLFVVKVENAMQALQDITLKKKPSKAWKEYTLTGGSIVTQRGVSFDFEYIQDGPYHN
jgi:hypothetical protein